MSLVGESRERSGFLQGGEAGAESSEVGGKLDAPVAGAVEPLGAVAAADE